MLKKSVSILVLLCFCIGLIGLVNASIPNGYWVGDWLVEKNVNATVSIKSPLGEFGNITSPVFVSWILSQTGEGESLTAADVWGYVTRTLTNLNNTRAARIDYLDATVSSRASQTSLDTLDGVADSTLSMLDAVDNNLDATVSSRASQTSLDTLDDYVDTEIASIISKIDVIDDYVDTEIAAIQASMTSTFTPYGYSAPETYTTANPVQNVWITAFDTSNIHGQIVMLYITNGDTATKIFEVKITIDGTALTLSGKSLTAGSAAYIYTTSAIDETLISSSAIHTFTYDLPWLIHYKTSLKLEYRTTSADVDAVTVKFRRVQ